MRTLPLIIGTMLTSIFSFAQNVTIPDANFKACLVGNTLINTNGDSEIQLTEAHAFTGEMKCILQNISDATGIEAFINLDSLDFTLNDLVSIDLSQNTKLDVVNLVYNELTSIDLSNNPELTYLYFESNLITSIDLTNKPLLKRLDFYDNLISTLDLSSVPLLEDLNCSFNPISNLDISNVPLLNRLTINGCPISDIDLSFTPNLGAFECHSSILSSLDLSQNPYLTTFRGSGFPMSQFDLSSNANLDFVEIFYCQNLTFVNVANGNNQNVYYFNVTDNPNLTCIQVDDTAFSTAYWMAVDSLTEFSLNCLASISTLTAEEIEVYPLPLSNELSIAFPQPESVTSLILFNSVGSEMKEYVDLNPTQEIKLDVSELPEGLYFIQLTLKDNNEVIVKKLVK